ncbi:hypothetical protein QQF64_000174 [Cirrhinus molitorella]|uniref:Ig-like domain-containing protein n=1 Tax=Cirrhinus molitorella TaxID=172907 RepID=A0ABR3NX75_9TELE
MKIIWTFTLMMIPGVVSSISVTGYSGRGVTIKCRYDKKYTDNAKYFCKGRNPGCSDLIKTETKDEWVHSGRFSLYDDTRAKNFNVTIRNLSEQDSGTYQCAADITWIGDSYTEVNLNVLTILILILTGLLLLFFCKKHQTQGGDSSSQAGAGKHDLVSQTGHEYDTQKQLPTNPSDSSDCVYSTVQERTDDSQIFITSSEDLNYALVNFNKKADCPDSVSLRNNQDYCEYTVVNHLTA